MEEYLRDIDLADKVTQLSDRDGSETPISSRLLIQELELGLGPLAKSDEYPPWWDGTGVATRVSGVWAIHLSRLPATNTQDVVTRVSSGRNMFGLVGSDE